VARRRSAALHAPLALVIAGSDPSGGAGLELDLKVQALFGVHAAAIASCHTTQTAEGVVAVVPSDGRRAERQFALLRAATPWRALQVGMVHDRAWIDRVARWAQQDRSVPLVLDPVVAPTRGPRTLAPALVEHYRRRLLPLATLLTPNADEAALLLGWSRGRVQREVDAALAALLALGPQAVLLKGGHFAGEVDVVDRLRGAFAPVDFRKPRRRGRAPRGTGCALAAAITSLLARGVALTPAVAAAEAWIDAARAAARTVGKGRPYLALVPPRAV